MPLIVLKSGLKSDKNDNVKQQNIHPAVEQIKNYL